uniref:Secreted protein n=1 Tax=Cacopsylla melanoneura TaxID=428564 RepID=A0A8D8TC67_9HEMI
MIVKVICSTVLVVAFLYPCDAAYDFTKGGEQPYPVAAASGNVCSAAKDPLCQTDAMTTNIGGGYQAQMAYCMNNTHQDISGVPDNTPLCYTRGFRTGTQFKCGVYTKDSKVNIRCDIYVATGGGKP